MLVFPSSSSYSSSAFVLPCFQYPSTSHNVSAPAGEYDPVDVTDDPGRLVVHVAVSNRNYADSAKILAGSSVYTVHVAPVRCTKR